MKKSTSIKTITALAGVLAVALGTDSANRVLPVFDVFYTSDVKSVPAEIIVASSSTDVTTEYSIDGSILTSVATASTISVASIGESRAKVAVNTDDDRTEVDPQDAFAIASAKMSGPVADLARIGGPQLVDLVIRYDDHPELFEDDRVESLGGEVVRNFNVFDMQA
ncbi:MAG: hypothetical protein ACR2Q3_08175, partial [Woeseiaceae bacterium]